MRPCARRVAAAEAGGAIAVASCELRVHASVSVRSAVCAIFSLPINLQAPVGHGPLASVLRLCHCLQLGRLGLSGLSRESTPRRHETRLSVMWRRVSCGYIRSGAGRTIRPRALTSRVTHIPTGMSNYESADYALYGRTKNYYTRQTQQSPLMQLASSVSQSVHPLLAHAGVVVGRPVWPSMPPCAASQRSMTR